MALSRNNQRQAADGAFADAAKVKRALVLDGVGDLGEALRRRILKITYDVTISVETEHERVALNVWLQKVRQTPDDLLQKRMRLQRIQRGIATINQRQPKGVAVI